MAHKTHICKVFTDKGKVNRIAFCLFWASMYLAVLLSRFFYSDGNFPYFHHYNPGLLQRSTTIVPFDLGEVSQMLTTLLLISSFLERALEVYVLTFRKKIDEKLDLETIKLNRSLEAVKGTDISSTDFDKEINNALEPLKKYEKSYQELLDVSTQSGVTATKKKENIIQKIGDLVIDNTEQISERTNTTRIYTMWSALLLGILISLIGIRGLGQFFSVDSQSTWQGNCFKIVDIILTGAVIAGGSDIIHKILQVVTTFMEAISTNNKAVAAANAPVK